MNIEKKLFDEENSEMSLIHLNYNII